MLVNLSVVNVSEMHPYFISFDSPSFCSETSQVHFYLQAL